MNLERDTVDALRILFDAYYEATEGNPDSDCITRVLAQETLTDAIRHLAYPDRALYPKRRGQRKTERRRVAG